MVVYEYDKQIYGINCYCSGFISSKLEHILPFFSQFKDLESYYISGEYFSLLEIKLKKYLDLQNLNISKKLFDDLQENNKLNQEGLLQFSKEK